MGNNHNKKIRCDDCDKHYSSRNVIFFKGKYRCKMCRQKLPNSSMNSRLPFIKPIEEYLNKTYKITPKSRNHNIGGMCYFNRVLIGKKFKIQIVEDSHKN